MRTFLSAAALGIALLLGACGAEPGVDDGSVPEHPAGPTIVLAVPDGRSRGDVAEILDARLREAGLGRATADAGDSAHVRCTLVASLSLSDAAHVAERLRGNGTFELRILAPEMLQRQEEQDGFLHPPAGHVWRSGPGYATSLVEIPEQAAERRLAEARDAGDDAIVLEHLEEALERVRAENVFTARDVVSASARPAGTTADAEILVQVEIAPRRADAFRRFTAQHLKRQLAIVVDGVVESAPDIQSPLPGSFVISGGRGGFTAAEAAMLAAIVTLDLELPERLELVRIEPAANPSGGNAEESR